MPTGTLKKMFMEKGFGFIAPDDGSGDLFAHKRALLGGDESTIQEGCKVSFESEVEERTGKPKARTWSIISGGAVPGMAMPGMAMPGMDYGAMAAAAANAARFSPYGAMPGMAMPGMGMPTGLPPGWEQVADPTTGNPYYCNRATGESSWTVPVAAAPVMQMVAPVPAAVPGLPPGWEAAADPASGKSYYFNRATGATTWEIPAA